MTDVEQLLRSALVPVDPPEALSDRLERGLSELTEAAADELADWELSAMRDPRNWGRPAAAVVVGTLAGGALVLVRARQQHRKRQVRGWQRSSAACATSAPRSRSACAASRRARRGLAGVEIPAPTPATPSSRWRTLSSVFTGTRPITIAAVPGDEAEQGDHDVHATEDERIRARGRRRSRRPTAPAHR